VLVTQPKKGGPPPTDPSKNDLPSYVSPEVDRMALFFIIERAPLRTAPCAFSLIRNSTVLVTAQVRKLLSGRRINCRIESRRIAFVARNLCYRFPVGGTAKSKQTLLNVEHRRYYPAAARRLPRLKAARQYGECRARISNRSKV